LLLLQRLPFCGWDLAADGPVGDPAPGRRGRCIAM